METNFASRKNNLLKHVADSQCFSDISSLLSMIPIAQLKATLKIFIESLQSQTKIRSSYYNLLNIQESIPSGVISQCISYLPFKQICNMSRTSKSIQKSCNLAFRFHDTLSLVLYQSHELKNSHFIQGRPFKASPQRIFLKSPNVLCNQDLGHLLHLHWHQFKYLQLRGINIMSVLETFNLQSMNHVISLKLYNCNDFQYLSIPLHANTWNLLARNCLNLRSFVTDFESGSSNTAITTNSKDGPLLPMQNLWILSIDDCPGLTVEYINRFVTAAPNLRHLCLYTDIDMSSNRKLTIPVKLVTLSLGFITELHLDFSDSHDLRHLDMFLRDDPIELANDIRVFSEFMNSNNWNKKLSISVQFNTAFVRRGITELLDNVGEYRTDLLLNCAQHLIDVCDFYIYKVEEHEPLFITFLQKLFEKENINVAIQGRVLYDVVSSVFGNKSEYCTFCNRLIDLGYELF